MLHVESGPFHARPSTTTIHLPDEEATGNAILRPPTGAMHHEETEMATLAARFVNSTNRHVFLTGKAGTGKTTLLRRLAEQTHKRYVILAPTGIAALNAGGVTIHSQFLLPFGSFIPERMLPADIPPYGNFHDRDTLTRRHPLNALRRQVLRALDLLIIDEVSMLRADLLDAIDHRMRSVRQRWDLPFGGVQVLLIGDLYQLPPVVKDEEWRVLQRWYRSAHFFEAHALQQSGYAHIELDRIFRQQDNAFIRILNNLRENTVTAADVDELNKHYRATITAEDSAGVITLATHNRQADELNHRALSALPGKVHRYEAKVEGDFPESMFPVLREIELKEGAQVMFTRNDAEKMYFNGKLARVETITDGTITVRMIDDEQPYTLKREQWENKRYVVDPVTKEQKEQILGVFEQLPIKLAWAITVHKSQGLTFQKAIIDVGQAFAPGQVYVALSRLRSLDGLILRTRISASVVSTDREVVAFSERRHSQPPLPDQLKEQQHHYLQVLLTSTFELGDLLKRAIAVQKEGSTTGTLDDAQMASPLALIVDKLKAEEETARRFQSQLLGLLQREERTLLIERIEKGAAYYMALLKDSMKELLQHLAQVEQMSRTKEYADELRELDGMLVKKIGTIAKAAHVTTCILHGTEIPRQPKIERQLADQRHAMVEEVRQWAAQHPVAGGRRKRRPTGPDDDLLGVTKPRKPKGEKKIKGETYLRTYVQLKEGKTLDEVAKERGLSLSTIEGHAVRGIAEGVLEITAVLPETVREVVATWMREHADLGLNDARAHFGDTYSYGQLRMVQAWLKGSEEEAGG